MTTTARTSYWFWSADSMLVEPEKKFHLKSNPKWSHDESTHGRRKSRVSIEDTDKAFIFYTDPEPGFGMGLETALDFNTRIRNNELRDIDKTRARALDALISQQEPFMEDTVLFRGVGNEIFEDVKIGQIMSDLAFTSTSENPDWIKRTFFPISQAGSNDIVLLNIKAPKGSRVLDVAEYFKNNFQRIEEERDVDLGYLSELYKDTAEFIFPTQSRFLVTDKLRQPSGTTFNLTYLPEAPELFQQYEDDYEYHLKSNPKWSHDESTHGRRKSSRKFSRLRDIKSWERKNFRGWSENLSEDELKSIAGYFLPGLEKIQIAAREKGIGDEFLDSAIAKARIPEDITVFRGMGTSKYKDAPLVGTLIEDKGYASTSLQRREAEQYLTAFKADEEDILLEILVPEGSRAMPISMLTSRPDAHKFGFDDPFGGEFSELVLPRNSRLEILSDAFKKTKTEIALLNSRTGEIILEPLNRTLRNLTARLLPEK